jgi:hypothetical protein
VRTLRERAARTDYVNVLAPRQAGEFLREFLPERLENSHEGNSQLATRRASHLLQTKAGAVGWLKPAGGVEQPDIFGHWACFYVYGTRLHSPLSPPASGASSCLFIVLSKLKQAL